MRQGHHLALVVLLAVGAACSIAASARPQAATLAPLDPGLEAALQSPDTVRVVVSLQQDAATRSAIQRGDAPAIRRAIVARASRVRAALPAAARVLDSYDAVPAISIEAPPDVIDALRRHPDVAHIALNRPIHPQLDESAALINADDVRTSLGVTGAGVTVAILDTGVETDHPALADDIVGQGCFISIGGCPQAAGVTAGCQQNSNTSGPYAEDGNGHGTHVTGIVTSDGHDGQDVGIARDASVKVFKVVNDCGDGEMGNVIAALDAILTSHPDVDVINMSVGDGSSNAPGTCEDDMPAMTSAVEAAMAAGMIIFASSGNTGSKSGITYPSCINDVVSVGAVYDESFGFVPYGSCIDFTSFPDKVGCFSQSGPGLDLLAPGALIESSYAGGDWLGLSGTSMSSPAAAAVAALVLDDEHSLPPAQLESRLKLTGKPILDTASGVTACRVDALKAVTNVGPLCLAPATDSDGDGCSDAEESTSSPAQGGARDSNNRWDFFDVTADAAIDLQDTLEVLGFFGEAAPDGSPNDFLDRYVPDLQQGWRTAEADDGIDLQDALASLRSFGTNCSAPP